jgi:acyl-CoA synthetase (AMP-forming)/AMP-acid ligase II
VQKFGLQPLDSVLQSIALGFDFAVSQLYPYLVAGGSVQLPEEEACKDLHALAAAVATGRTTSVDFVPTMFSLLVESKDITSRFKSVRRINLGGEAVSYDLCGQIMSSLEAQLFVTYGPTEASVDTTTWRVPRPFEPPQAVACLIGLPDAWRALHITDPTDPGYCSAPAGTPGELCIDGPGLADKYLNLPEESDRAFVASAFSSGNSYRSGDLVRWRGLLGLDFLGRIDSQVKLRGQRIELGEIENVLRGCSGVSEAKALVVDGSATGSQVLVAFIGPATTDHEGLLGQLADRLPAAFVPKLLISLDEWPRNRSGKVDLKALARQAQAQLVAEADEAPSSMQAFVPEPQQPAAAVFVQAVASVLGRSSEKLNISESFARLGGDSIAAIRVSARLREQGLAVLPSQMLSRVPIAQLCSSGHGCEGIVTSWQP